ncbi:MAG: superoxide dismutase family protein [Sphingomonadaceae bacterium]
MVKNIIASLAATGAAALALSPALADEHAAPSDPPHVAVVDASGAQVGTLVLQETPAGVLIAANVTGLPPGEHGFHLHEKGICDPAEGFTTSGGHYAPRSNSHGFKEAAGPHAGDMPNQFADGEGTLRAHVLNPFVTMGPGVATLNDADGTALVIHEGKDDYTSQPSGAAGKRLACAVIAAPKEM